MTLYGTLNSLKNRSGHKEVEGLGRTIREDGRPSGAPLDTKPKGLGFSEGGCWWELGRGWTAEGTLSSPGKGTFSFPQWSLIREGG